MRTYRRFRRWMRHTPNSEIALSLLASGAVVLIGVLVFAVVLY